MCVFVTLTKRPRKLPLETPYYIINRKNSHRERYCLRSINVLVQDKKQHFKQNDCMDLGISVLLFYLSVINIVKYILKIASWPILTIPANRLVSFSICSESSRECRLTLHTRINFKHFIISERYTCRYQAFLCNKGNRI